MQLDSYRHRSQPAASSTPSETSLQTSFETVCTMPCQMRSRCHAAVNETVTSAEGVKIYTWRAVRWQNLRMLRKQTRTVVLLMALIEALRHGPLQLVYAGTHGFPASGPEDFGIAYNVSYFLSWLYVCLFMVIYVPLFSWWLPADKNDTGDSKQPTGAAKTVELLTKINLYLLPFTIGLCLVQHLYYTVSTFVYVDARAVDSRALPSNTRKNWLARVMLLVGVLLSTSTGYGVFQILGAADLAHVKQIEYLIIVLPIQVNIGLVLGSAMQYRMEQRIARKEAAAAPDATEVDEKQALLDV